MAKITSLTAAAIAAALCLGAALAAAGPAAAAGPITERQAIKTARWSASERLAMAGVPFSVKPRQWRVDCRRRGGWVCGVRQGPCHGRLRIQRVTRGGGLRGIGRVGCVAD